MSTTPTFYIDPSNGRAGGAGTESDPALTFPTPLVTGTVYGLKRGTTLTLAATSNVTISEVAFVAYGDPRLPRPKIDANGNVNPLLVNTTTADQFYAESIHFTGVATDTVCAVEIQAVTNAHLNDCVIDCTGSGGILINGADATVVIENCDIIVSESGKRGIYVLAAPAGTVIRNNRVRYVGSSPTSANQGIALPSGAGASLVEGNQVEGWFTGIEVDSSDGHTILENRVLSCTNEGIALTGADSNRVEGNYVAYTFNGTNVGFGMIVSGSSQDNSTLRNYFRANHQSYVDTSTGGGNDFIANYCRDSRSNHVSFQADSTNRARIMNNTLKHTPVVAGHAFVVQGTLTNAAVDFINNLVYHDVRLVNCQCIEIAGTITTRAVYIQGNHYYVENGAHLAALDNVEYDGLPAWKAAVAVPASITGDDSRSVMVDPQISNWDEPIPSRPATGITDPMGGMFNDMAGRPFPNPPQPGAYQNPRAVAA